VTKRDKDYLHVQEHPIWSPTRLDLAETCMKAYWFQYVKHIKHSITPDIARGKLIHSLIEKFWRYDEDKKLLVPGYKSYESFVNCAIRDWKYQFARTGESDGQKIDWDYKGQQWSKKFLGELADVMGRVYSRYIIERPRLAAEVEIKGEIEGIKISAKIDELREDLVIRDHKSGRKTPREHYLDKNMQMTDYLVCLFIALHDINSPIATTLFPDYTFISLDEFLKIATIEIHHLPEHQTKEEKEIGRRQHMTAIYSAKRTRASINDFVSSLQAKEKQLAERDFHPSKGRNCDFCFYRNECNSYDPQKEHETEFAVKNPLFTYANLTFKPPVQKTTTKRLQRTFRFSKLEQPSLL
jgi:hypothetical protein